MDRVTSEDRAASRAHTTVIVDGNNVIGTRPDGWWRDRAGAAGALLTRLQRLAALGEPSVEVVFDVAPAGVGEGLHERVRVHSPRRHGRDAADDRIVALLADRDAREVEVVTSDRALAARVRARGAAVTGARTFLERLDASGC